MRKVFDNEYVVLLARVVLGVVFIVSSADKILWPSAFAVSIDNYKVLSHNGALIAATVLPWMELICGVCLLCGIAQRGAALLAGVLLMVFTGAVLSAMARGLDISCGCFTQDPDAAKIGWLKIVENCGLIGTSLLVTLSQTSLLSLENVIRKRVVV